MKAAVLALSAAALLPLGSLRAQSGSPYVETSTVTFYWSFTDSYISNVFNQIPDLPSSANFDPSTYPQGYQNWVDTLRAQPYTGSPAGKIPAAATHDYILNNLVQRLARNHRLPRQTVGWRWQLIAVREVPANVHELATNPYRLFLSGQSGSSTVATNYEVPQFRPQLVTDDPVPPGIGNAVTVDTGITITLGQYSGNYTETDWGVNNNRVRRATGNVATSFQIDFGAIFYDDPLHNVDQPNRDPYNFHLRRHYWRASAAGLLNYSIRTIAPLSNNESWLPTFVATNVSGTATGWFEHSYTEYVFNEGNYRTPTPNPNYFGAGIAPLRVEFSTIQYQQRSKFRLDAPAAPSSVATTTTAEGGVNVSWVNALGNNETGFVIERADTEDGPWEPIIIADTGGSPFTDGDVDPDRIYYYRIYAINGGGASDYTEPVVATTILGPTELDAGATGTNEITLQWIDRSEVETGFEVQRRRDGSNTWQTIATPDDLPPDSTSFTDGTVSSSTKYFYRVRAIHDPYGASAWSNEDDATTAAPGGGGGNG